MSSNTTLHSSYDMYSHYGQVHNDSASQAAQKHSTAQYRTAGFSTVPPALATYRVPGGCFQVLVAFRVALGAPLRPLLLADERKRAHGCTTAPHQWLGTNDTAVHRLCCLKCKALVEGGAANI